MKDPRALVALLLLGVIAAAIAGFQQLRLLVQAPSRPQPVPLVQPNISAKEIPIYTQVGDLIGSKLTVEGHDYLLLHDNLFHSPQCACRLGIINF